MQQLRIQTEDAAALSLANVSRLQLFHTNLRETPRVQSGHFGEGSQAAPSIQIPERQRELTIPATKQMQQIPGHLSFLARNSLALGTPADRQKLEQNHERAIMPAALSAPRVPSVHTPAFTIKSPQISYPVLGPTPKFPGHLSNVIDNISTSPFHPPSRISPRPAESPPSALCSRQPPRRNVAPDCDTRPNDGDRKSQVISIIRAITSRPLDDTKTGVIADMILQSQTLNEIEAIILALDQSFPVVSVMGRLRNIVNVHDQGYALNFHNSWIE